MFDNIEFSNTLISSEVSSTNSTASSIVFTDELDDDGSKTSLIIFTVFAGSFLFKNEVIKELVFLFVAV